MEKNDIGVIGLGIAGSLAVFKIAKEYKNLKIIGFDLGRPPAKRRKAGEGWFGYFQSGDGKLYLNDTDNVLNLVGARKTNSAFRWLKENINDTTELKTIKDKSPSVSMSKKIKKGGFELKLNNYIQLYPKDIHILSKYMAGIVSDNKNISLSFDNEVLNIVKQKNSFIITSNDKQVECKRIMVCTGRSGWRWTKALYDSLGIVEDNNIAKFGIRIEASSSVMKDFNKSNCSIFKENLDLGPMCWNGSVIPEDHMDFAISSFRGNEQRWYSDKVSFNLIGSRYFENAGSEQTNRLGQLTFILANDRIVKERVSTILAKKSKISVIPEYDWLIAAINYIGQFIPDIITRGSYHIPTILPLVPKINIGNNLETDIKGMFVAGEASGNIGILYAILSGLIAADSILK